MAYKAKLAYVVHLSVHEILREGRFPVFATFTFRENVIDTKEAHNRWRKLKERIRRRWRDQAGIGVWQRQHRGAWHLHYVFKCYMQVAELREMALACGFGPFVNLRHVAGGNAAWTTSRVVKYLTRYVTREMSETDKGVRVVDRLGKRNATARFSWANGFAFLFRKGMAAYNDVFARELGPVCVFEDYWFVIRLGFEWCSLDERDRVLRSDSVFRWWAPQLVPY